MNIKELEYLLCQDEGATLEFKRDMYAIYSTEPKVPEKHRGELIKDILSLANGSFDTVGKEAHLIVGAEDNIGPDGKRKTYGVEGRLPTRIDILNSIREVSNPPLQDLETEVIEYEGKNIWVITIPPSPNVHETKKVLKTTGTSHFAHIVFIRRDSTIDNASTNERIALEKLKKINIDQQQKLPSIIVGAVSGAFFLSSFMGRNTVKITDGKVSNRVGFITGLLVGAFTGGSIGYSSDQFAHLAHEIRKLIYTIRE